ncbi:MAG: hypothetical protein GQ574_03870 [Crocinitomix sp.]|nr:hypothetical protein [Crocinitomix sp.]
MKNGLLFILVLLFTSPLFAQQKDESRAYTRMGPQVGIMLTGKANPQTHSVDIFTNSRLMSLNLEGGIGYYLNKSNRLELNGSVGGFGLRDKKYKAEVLSRSDAYFLYNDFELDATNSTGNALRDFKVVIEYIHDLSIQKWKFSPSFGGGLRQVNHRDYKYGIRENTANQSIIYSLTSHTKPNFFYRLGLRFFHERWPDAEWYLNFSGGDVKYSYSIQETDPFSNSVPFTVNYRRHLLVVSAGIKLKILFSDYGTN